MKKTLLFRLAFAATNPAEFRKTATLRHQAILSRFAFADDQSEINAYQILRGEPMPLIPNPITLITGLPGTGKTTLARILGKASSGREVMTVKSINRGQINRSIETAILYGVSPILFDNLFRFDCFQSIRRLENATAPAIRVRRIRSEMIEDITDLPQILITCPHDTAFPEDLARRSRIIRLAPLNHSAAA